MIVGLGCFVLGRGDSENNAITIVETVIFTIMSTITIVGCVSISVHKYHDERQ